MRCRSLRVSVSDFKKVCAKMEKMRYAMVCAKMVYYVMVRVMIVRHATLDNMPPLGDPQGWRLKEGRL